LNVHYLIGLNIETKNRHNQHKVNYTADRPSVMSDTKTRCEIETNNEEY